MGSPFDRSVFCSCTRGVWQRSRINLILWIVVIGLAFSGMVVGGVYLGKVPNPGEPYEGIRQAWLGLTITSFLLAFLLSLYPGRYLSGYQNDVEQERTNTDISHVICTYIVTSVWAIQTFMGVGFAFNQADWNHNYSSSDGLIMTATSFWFAMIIGFINMVFTPIIPLWFQACGLRSASLGLTDASQRFQTCLLYTSPSPRD